MKRYTDKQRLDWLGRAGSCAEHDCYSIRSWYIEEKFAYTNPPTLRHAIDSAMRRDKGGKNG